MGFSFGVHRRGCWVAPASTISVWVITISLSTAKWNFLPKIGNFIYLWERSHWPNSMAAFPKIKRDSKATSLAPAHPELAAKLKCMTYPKGVAVWSYSYLTKPLRSAGMCCKLTTHLIRMHLLWSSKTLCISCAVGSKAVEIEWLKMCWKGRSFWTYCWWQQELIVSEHCHRTVVKDQRTARPYVRLRILEDSWKGGEQGLINVTDSSDQSVCSVFMDGIQEHKKQEIRISPESHYRYVQSGASPGGGCFFLLIFDTAGSKIRLVAWEWLCVDWLVLPWELVRIIGAILCSM